MKKSPNSLQPSKADLEILCRIASKFVIDEQMTAANNVAYFLGVNSPSWVHSPNTAREDSSSDFLEAILSETLPEQGNNDLHTLIADILKPLSRMGTNDNSPGYAAFIPSGGLFHAALAEWIAAALNRYVTTFDATPGLASIEIVSVRWLADILGMTKTARSKGCKASGLLLSGASIGALHAVHAAKVKKDSIGQITKLTAYYPETAHCSIEQALTICGIDNSRSISVDSNFQLNIRHLEDCIVNDIKEGYIPFMAAGNAGDVRSGTVDDLIQLREICDRYEMWLHVDAAYGGFFALTSRGRDTLNGLSDADSVTIDPHKGLGFPYGLGALLVKDENTLLRAFSYDTDYLQLSTGERDLANMGIEYTREFRGLQIWLSLKLLGISPFRDHLNFVLDQTEYILSKLIRIHNIQIIKQAEMSIILFQLIEPHGDDENRLFLDRINGTGEHFLSGCTLPEAVGGGFALRIALLSFRTSTTAVDKLIDKIAREATMFNQP